MIVGLPQDPRIVEYLEKRYGLFRAEDLRGIPVFTDQKTWHVGGYKNFYSVVLDSSIDLGAVISEAEKKYSRVQFAVSMPTENMKMSHFLLDIRNVADAQDRFQLYSKKVRNQTKKSHEFSEARSFKLTIGPAPADFYALYAASLRRLGSVPRDPQWFAEQERLLHGQIVCFSVHDGTKLIGCNYCVAANGFVHLMFNVSDTEYWQYNINNRLYDELIAWAISNGYSFVDFGPSLSTDEKHNHFKIGFGAKQFGFVESGSGPVAFCWDFFKKVLRKLQSSKT